MSYAASDATLPQAPGLKDDVVEAGTDSLDRAEDREIGLGSNPGLTNKATTAMHQGMDQATGEGSTKTGEGAEDKAKGVGAQISETVGGVLNSVTDTLKK